MKRRGMLLALVMAGLLAILTAGCSEETKETAEKNKKDDAGSSPAVVIAEDEFDPAVWGQVFPLQYQSYLKNSEELKTTYGGSVKESKFISEPEIIELFKGYGFSKSYNEDRGHTFALDDMLSSGRVGEATPGSCLTCKTPSAVKKIKDMGLAYYSTPVLELAKDVKHSIACADCHEPGSPVLKVERPAFISAMKERGIDVTKASQKEMRTYVCAQCHVEYYFAPGTKEVTFPWAKGLEPDKIEEYYNELAFSDWEHPDSKAKMRKVQHPEFETWSTGVHGTAGVSCADCHMPKLNENGQTYSSHQWTSPLKAIEFTCTTCHSKGVDWLKDRVANTQDRTYKLLKKASQVNVQAHAAIKEALAAKGADQTKIQEAQKMVVKAQWYWDWVAAENSMGFHNPIQAVESLGNSIDYAYQAINLAKSAQ